VGKPVVMEDVVQDMMVMLGVVVEEVVVEEEVGVGGTSL